MVELSIVDIREIIRLVKTKSNFDLSDYALTSLKYSIEKLILKNGILSTEGLFRRISDEPEFMDTLLYQISVPSTEMFRDPSLWRWFRESVLNSPDTRFENYKIWLPSCVSGGELYTICIILKEQNLLDKVRIIATHFSDQVIEYVKNGEYPLKRLETSIENYKRFKGKDDFKSYYELKSGIAIRDSELIKNVEFIKDDINYNNTPKNVKLILFRNSMIYFNPKLQSRILEKLYSTLSVSGYLMLGTQEKIRDINTGRYNFDRVIPEESIYKKKIKATV